MRFLRNVLATLVGLFVFFGLITLIFAGIISAASSEEEVEVEANSVLKLELNQPIVERENDDPFSDLSFPGNDNAGVIGLVELRRAIQAAKDDDNIKGIYLVTGVAPAGWATYEEIRNDLIDFKASGKFMVAYSEFLTESGYYLGSVADELHLFPEGLVEFNGLYQGVTFLKEALEKLGVEPRVFRVGQFKGAVEPFLRNDISEENRMQIESYLGSIYNTYLQGLAQTTDLSEAKLRSLADSMQVFLPQDAVDQGMVTQLSYDDQVKESIRRKLGIEEEEADEDDEDDEDINFISLDKYRRSLDKDDDYSRNRVAVIVAEGTIVNGNGDNTSIGGEKFAKEIRKAREDDNVKAVVLRINSGGGSASASDQMWREVQLTKEVKPVIASMSTYAASGGYYMAMGCDTIVAQPNTITGSIGIFGLFFGAQELLEQDWRVGRGGQDRPAGRYSGSLATAGARRRAHHPKLREQRLRNLCEQSGPGTRYDGGAGKRTGGRTRLYREGSPRARSSGYTGRPRHRGGHCRPARQPGRGRLPRALLPGDQAAV